MSETLREWYGVGWLVAHETSREEIRELLAIVDRDLADSRLPGLSVDASHNHAYNAALQLAKAALAAAGYRPAREVHHYRAIDSLLHTVGLDAAIVRRLDTARKKRNRAEYDSVGAISVGEADEVRMLAEDLRARVAAWLEREHTWLA